MYTYSLSLEIIITLKFRNKVKDLLLKLKIIRMIASLVRVHFKPMSYGEEYLCCKVTI